MNEHTGLSPGNTIPAADLFLLTGYGRCALAQMEAAAIAAVPGARVSQAKPVVLQRNISYERRVFRADLHLDKSVTIHYTICEKTKVLNSRVDAVRQVSADGKNFR